MDSLFGNNVGGHVLLYVGTMDTCRLKKGLEGQTRTKIVTQCNQELTTMVLQPGSRVKMFCSDITAAIPRITVFSD